MNSYIELVLNVLSIVGLFIFWILPKIKSTIELTIKSKFDERLKKLDHAHSITQKTYQEMFEKKIHLYDELAIIVSEYDYNVKEDPSFELYNQPTSIYIEHVQKLNTIMQKNAIYISNELWTSFSSFYNKYAPLYQYEEAKNIYYDNQDENAESPENDYSKVIKETAEEFKKLHKQIWKDIELLRHKINFMEDK